MVACACSPSTQRGSVPRTDTVGTHVMLGYEASLGYMRSCLRNEAKPPMVQTLLKRHLYQVCCSRYPCLVRFFAYVLLSHEMPAFAMARQCVLRVLCSSRSHYASSCYINNRKLINPQSVGNVKAPVPLLTYRTACSKVV